jgi:hypothetical protein
MLYFVRLDISATPMDRIIKWNDITSLKEALASTTPFREVTQQKPEMFLSERSEAEALSHRRAVDT